MSDVRRFPLNPIARLFREDRPGIDRGGPAAAPSENESLLATLEEARADLMDAIELSSDAYALFDSSDRLVRCNHRYREYFSHDDAIVVPGMSFESILRRSAVKRFAPGQRGEWEAWIQRRLQGHRHPEGTFEHQLPDGRWLKTTDYRTARGTVFTVHADVTEEKRSIRAAEEREQRLRAIFETVLDGIVTMDADGTIESFNPATKRIFGYSADRVVGHHVHALVAEAHREALDAFITGDLARNKTAVMGGREDPIEGRRSDGQTFPMELLANEMWLGATRKFTAVVRDDTERQKLDRMKNEFISTVSHELRTPLTSIGGALGLIEGGLAGELPDKAAHLVSVARANCERLVRLINDVLDVEKMESGRMAFHVERLDLGTVVAKAIEANAAAAAVFDVGLAIDEGTPGVAVLADHDRLMQVLTNLISNAAKYSPPGDTVIVSTREAGELARVTVTDRGPGIPTEFHARIFSKFGQADSSDSRAKGGTGLGLHICRTIVERMGGTIDFDTEVGAGCRFYFTLPRSHLADAPALPANAPHILICDSDDERVGFLSTVLAEGGIAAAIAHTAGESRRMLERGDFAAMLLALELPDRAGISLVRQLRESERGAMLPILLVSAAPPDGDGARPGGLVPIADWLERPSDCDGIVAAVRGIARHTAPSKPRVLLVEADANVARVVSLVLGGMAELTVAADADEARAWLDASEYDLAVIDPGGRGSELLPGLAAREPAVPVLVSASRPGADVVRDIAAAVEGSTLSADLVLATTRAAIAHPSPSPSGRPRPLAPADTE